MATYKKVFTLRLQEEIFDKIDALAKEDHRSTTNLIEYILLSYITRYEEDNGEIMVSPKEE